MHKQMSTKDKLNRKIYRETLKSAAKYFRNREDFDKMPPTVPSSRHTCENFQSRHEDQKDSASSHI